MASKITKRILTATLGVGAIVSTIGAVISCGSITYGPWLYYEVPYSYKAKNRSFGIRSVHSVSDQHFFQMVK